MNHTIDEVLQAYLDKAHALADGVNNTNIFDILRALEPFYGNAEKQQLIDALKDEGGAQLTALQSALPALIPPDWPLDAEGQQVSIPDYLKKRTTPPGAAPFLFAGVSRYGDGSYGIGQYTTEEGYFHSGQGIRQLNIITGFHDFDNTVRAFYDPPSIQYITGSTGQFIYRRLFTRQAQTGNINSYPRFRLACLFVKNTTGADITRTLTVGGSSYSGYGGAGLNIVTPDAVNLETVTELTETNLWNYQSSTHNANSSTSITVPANKTIAVVLYFSSYYYTASPTGAYSSFEHLYLRNVRSTFLTEGLEFDIERTLRAHYNPVASADPAQIWN